jgi:hypothetical protein
MHTSTRPAAIAVAALFLTACESGGAHATGPRGSDAFARFVAIGTSITMGVQSGGVLYDTQVQAWPSLLAHQSGAVFAMPLLRTPGCSPPLVAPLQLARLLSGASVLAGDSSCAGAFGTALPPLNNVALSGATAWDALNLTPKAIAAAPARYGAGDRARYPLALGSTQSQVTAMIIERPSLVSVELGLAEVLSAATTGLLAPAASYTQSASFTYVPAAVFAPLYAAIVDSAKQKTGAIGVLLSVPHVARLYGMRPAAELWADRVELATFGVAVAADCNASGSFVFTPSIIPKLAALAASAGVPQELSCADVPGTADAVLTSGDVTTLNSVVDQMNAQIRQLADSIGWAFADLDSVFSGFTVARASYRASEEIGCVYPYGAFLSLDGVHPNVAGHQSIANAVAAAINAKYGFEIPATTGIPVARAVLCP